MPTRITARAPPSFTVISWCTESYRYLSRGLESDCARLGYPFRLYRLDVEELLASQDPDYLLVSSSAPSDYVPGQKYVYPIAALSKHGRVQYRLVSGPEGMTVSKEGVVSWIVPADYQRLEVRAELELTDAGGLRTVKQPLRLGRAAQLPLAPVEGELPR